MEDKPLHLGLYSLIVCAVSNIFCTGAYHFPVKEELQQCCCVYISLWNADKQATFHYVLERVCELRAWQMPANKYIFYCKSVPLEGAILIIMPVRALNIYDKLITKRRLRLAPKARHHGYIWLVFWIVLLLTNWLDYTWL